MFNRNARWAWLMLFAITNLLFWVGVAVMAGLVIGDEVDLGVETRIRSGQATGVAWWKQASQRTPKPSVAPTVTGQASPPAPTQTAKRQPPATITWPVPPTPLPTGQSLAAQVAMEAPVEVPFSPGNIATPEPEATLVSSPLLMANPEISTLTKLDTEMSHSAPYRAVQIRYQEDALNAEIATLWRNNPELPFRDVRVDLQRDQVIVTGKVTVLGFGVTARATGQVVIQECVPQLEIESISIAGVMTPRFVKEQVEDMILEAMTWYPADYPLCLEQIVLEETRLSIYGYRR
jgi:hypothetical protein